MVMKVIPAIIIITIIIYWVAKHCLKCLTLHILLNLLLIASLKEKYSFYTHRTFKWDKDLSNFSKLAQVDIQYEQSTTEPELVISIIYSIHRKSNKPEN